MVDSLLNRLKISIQDTNRANTLCRLAQKGGWAIGKYDTALIIAQQAFDLSKKLQHKRGIASSLNSMGIAYYQLGYGQKALNYYYQSLEYYETLGDKKGIGNGLNNIALIYKEQGNIPKSLEHYEKSLKYFQSNNEKKGIAMVLNNIASIYKDQGDLDKSKEYHLQSLKIKEEIGDKNGIAQTLVNLGVSSIDNKDYKAAQDYFERSVQFFKETNSQKDLAFAYMCLGNVNLKQKNNLTKTFDYYQQALSIYKITGNKLGVTQTLTHLAEAYGEDKDYLKATDYANQGLLLSKEIENVREIKEAAKYLSSVYKKVGNSEEALKNYELYIQMRDSLVNKENTKKTIQHQVQYEFDKKEAASKIEFLKAQNQKQIEIEKRQQAIVLLEKDNELKELNLTQSNLELKQKQTEADAKNKEVELLNKDKQIQEVLSLKKSKDLEQEKKQRYYLYCGLVLVLLFAGFMFNRFKVTQKQSKIITQQKHVIEERHKEITDSINYAERIQRSMLATNKSLTENLKEHFVLFKPKDVVSGDFYWTTKLANNYFVIATADSTGHGVPGAIMSMMNMNSLKEVVKTGYTKPHDILNYTRDIIIETLKNDGSVEGGKDGMDCSLCVYDLENMKLFTAAANNPIWIVRDFDGSETKVVECNTFQQQIINNKQLIEIKPDKMPVGKHTRQDVPFTLNEINLQKGDIVYTLTDGFPDQFGGNRGKKFMIKNLRELLLSNAHLPMAEQKQLLEQTFTNWTGNLDQVDDVTIIGVKI